MRQNTQSILKGHRLNYNLTLKDVAYLLDMDEGNLSRFEAGKSQNSKALLGYHFLFNLSIDMSISQVSAHPSDVLVHRCFKLLEILGNQTPTLRVRNRIQGVERIITQLNQEEYEYED